MAPCRLGQGRSEACMGTKVSPFARNSRYCEHLRPPEVGAKESCAKLGRYQTKKVHSPSLASSWCNRCPCRLQNRPLVELVS